MLPQIDLAFDEAIEKDIADQHHLDATAKHVIAEAVKTAELIIPTDAELSLMIAGDALLQELNKQWRDIDKPTNVLSFPSCEMQVGDTPQMMLGDIVISLDTTSREADLENKAFDDHFSHLVVHGFLHLFGYDHETELEAQQMESLETKILANIGIADPYDN